jgi:hypothetical protein
LTEILATQTQNVESTASLDKISTVGYELQSSSSDFNSTSSTIAELSTLSSINTRGNNVASTNTSVEETSLGGEITTTVATTSYPLTTSTTTTTPPTTTVC